jgi:hypothetical protein
MIYCEKELSLTVGILAANKSFEQIRTSYESVFSLRYEASRLVAIMESEDDSELKQKKINYIKKGICLTSMIDELCKVSSTDWIYIVFAGRKLPKNIDGKLSRYIQSYKDVIFPVVNRVWNFVDGSLDGLLINKKFHSEVGNFGSGDNLNFTKLVWADKAMSLGARFKAIVGAT